MSAIIQTETCANCGNPIGRLETPHLWREEVVCAGCHGKLARPAAAPTSTAAASQVIMVAAPSHPRVQTIQATGKLWKGLSALSMLAVIVGTVTAGVGISGAGVGWIVLGVAAVVLGIGMSIIARLGAWWFHG